MVEQEFKISSEAEPMTYRQNSNNKRVLFFDQIKALMVALVIVIHILFALLFGWYGVRIPSEEFSDPLFQVAAGWYIYFVKPSSCICCFFSRATLSRVQYIRRA